MSGMIFGSGDDAWIERDVTGKLMRNGSFVQITFQMSGVTHTISITARDIKRIAEVEKHGEGFEALVVLSEPATPATLAREEGIRAKDLMQKIYDSRPRR